MIWPRSLLARITLAIAGVAFVFQALAVAAIVGLVLIPQGKRAGDQFAALIVYAANSWARLPDSQRGEYAKHVWKHHALQVHAAGRSSNEHLTEFLPFYVFLESEVRQRAGLMASLYGSHDAQGRLWVWVDVPTQRGVVTVGFDRTKHPQFPPLAGALALIFIVGTLAALAVSAYFARHLTRPLRNLSQSVQCVGRGQWPTPLPEDGPDEFIHCIRSFNRMTQQIQDLLADRTTLLAGISHDLRTPLARMRLALAMLADKHDPVLTRQLMSDVDDMNALINRCLEVGHGFEEAHSDVDIRKLLIGVLTEMGVSAEVIEVAGSTPCIVKVPPIAVRRIFSNLLDNAIKYAGKNGLRIEVDCKAAEICFLDAGPGIPEAQLRTVFRPFYRVEPSRSEETGGNGLGLAVTRQLAESNGWRVVLENRAVGGLCARVMLAPCKR